MLDAQELLQGTVLGVPARTIDSIGALDEQSLGAGVNV